MFIRKRLRAGTDELKPAERKTSSSLQNNTVEAASCCGEGVCQSRWEDGGFYFERAPTSCQLSSSVWVWLLVTRERFFLFSRFCILLFSHFNEKLSPIDEFCMLSESFLVLVMRNVLVSPLLHFFIMRNFIFKKIYPELISSDLVVKFSVLQ